MLKEAAMMDIEKEAERIKVLLKTEQFDQIPHTTLTRLAESVLLTSEHDPQGTTIVRRLGIVAVSGVSGVFVLRDLFAKFRDFFGGRSGSYQKVIDQSTQQVLRELQVAAFKRGANAVVGIDLDYNQVTGKGTGMFSVVANGTAVYLYEHRHNGDAPPKRS